MYRILIIETGEYLYSVAGKRCLYTPFELKKYKEEQNSFIFETNSKQEVEHKLKVSDDACNFIYRLRGNGEETLYIVRNKEPEAFEIVEV